MALFKPYKIVSSKLDSLPIKEGQLIFVTDTKAIYLDIDSKQRIKITSNLISDLTNDSNFITSETDPVFGASAAAAIKATDISKWNNKQDAITFNSEYNASSNKAATMKDIPSLVTTEKDGLMSSEDKTKLDSLENTSKVVVSQTEPTTLKNGDVWIVIEEDSDSSSDDSEES